MSWWLRCCCWGSDSHRQKVEEEKSSTEQSITYLESESLEDLESSEEMGKVVSKVSRLLHTESEEADHVVPSPSASAQEPLTEEQLYHDSFNARTTISSSSPVSLVTPRYPLATPRSPLRPAVPDSPSAKPPPKRLKEDFEHLDYPILRDDSTISYVQCSKVIIIMKGLPGSGKSFLVARICDVYRDVAVCSADHYFEKDGKYQFDAELLKEAHECSQAAARAAGERGTAVIVVDNTNIRNWEMKAYLEVARDHCYVPLVLEPLTPWAHDPHQLQRKNKHEVPLHVLVKKVKSYQPVSPIYYGWFLNENDSENILLISQNWLKEAISKEEFFKDLSHYLQLSCPQEVLNLYNRKMFKDGGQILHCTAMFTARGKVEGAQEYMASAVVKGAMGRCFVLHIIGFVITPRTFGARLRLTPSQLELWGNDDTEAPPLPSMTNTLNDKEKDPPQTNIAMDMETAQTITEEKCTDTHVFSTERKSSCCLTIEEVQSSNVINRKRFNPTLGKGSRAHITLACAPGVKPVTTGHDLVRVVELEMLAEDDPTVETHQLPGASLRNYGEGQWVLYLERELQVKALFSAYLG